MRYLILFCFVLLFYKSSLGQLSVEKLDLIQQKIKPLARKSGFYSSTLRYLRNTPQYEPSIRIIKESENNARCAYYTFELTKDYKHSKGKLWRRTSCFVKSNILYLKTADSRKSYMKVLVPGYFSLVSCNPQTQSNQLGLVGALENIGTYDNQNGTIMNLGTSQTFSLNKSSLRKILSNEKDLYEQYKEEENPKSFSVMIDYLIKLNERVTE